MPITPARRLSVEGSYHEMRRLMRTRDAVATPVERLRRGAYFIGPRSKDAVGRHRELVEATLSQLAGNAIVSHVSAAVIHGLPVPLDALTQVWVTTNHRGGGHDRPGLRTMGCPLADDEVEFVEGIAVTTALRTVVDVARVLPARDAVPMADALLARGVAREQLVAAVDSRPGRKGNARARWVCSFADARSESWGESVSRVLMHDCGLPSPELQHSFVDKRGVLMGRSDFWWPTFGVVGEFDGLGKYDELLPRGVTPAQAFAREKDRDAWLYDQGFWVVRWGTEHLRAPGALAARGTELSNGQTCAGGHREGLPTATRFSRSRELSGLPNVRHMAPAA